MRLYWNHLALALTTISTVAAFAPASQKNHAPVRSTSSALQQVVATAEVKANQKSALEKLKAKDAASRAITMDVSLTFIFIMGRLLEQNGGGERGYPNAKLIT
jgi:hypothetical protein